MSILLTWSEVDTAIQNEMANQSPSESKRLEAVNDVLQDLNVKYDLENSKRTKSISVIPNGQTAYALSTLVTDNDVKKIADVRYPITDNETGSAEFEWIDPDKFYRDAIDARSVNQYTTYWEDNVHYLKVMATALKSTAQTFTMIYYSYFVAIDGSDDFAELLVADSNYKINLPRRFKKLIVNGALEKIWPMALGDDADRRESIARNKYGAELVKLGLEGSAHKTKTKIRRVKIKQMW